MNYNTQPQMVHQIVQSPINKLRWVLGLECGHCEWITRKTRPTLKKYRCSKCEASKSK